MPCLTCWGSSWTPGRPADEQQHGDIIDLLVGERGDGVDDVALAGVLHIDDTYLAGGEVVAGGEADGGTFVGGDDVVAGVDIVGDIGADVLQQRVRHTGVEVDIVLFQLLDKEFRTDHIF